MLPMKSGVFTRRAQWMLPLVCLTIFFFRIAHGQTTEAGIKARLLDQPLYLRGCEGEGKLQFDPAGKPLKNYTSISFTVSGIRITQVHLRGDLLKLQGDRIGLEFDKSGKMTRVPIGASEVFLQVRLEVQAPADMNFGPALDAIFATDLAQVPSARVSYWQEFAAGRWLPPNSPCPSTRQAASWRKAAACAAGGKPCVL